MNELVMLWFAGCAVVASILMWWFNTFLLVHFLEIFRMLGFRKKNKNFWSVPVDGELRNDLAHFTREDLETWLYTNWHPKLAELVSCPGCFSAHASFWVAVAMQVGLQEVCLPFFVLCWLGWPSISNVLLTKIRGTFVSSPNKDHAIKVQEIVLQTKGSVHKDRNQGAAPVGKGREEKQTYAIKTETVGAKTVGENQAIRALAVGENQAAMPMAESQSEEAMAEAAKRKQAAVEASHALLTARGIKFHTDTAGTVHVDYMPRREIVIGQFLDSDNCPEEIPDCYALKEQMTKETQKGDGTKCVGCELNKIRNKYRQILINILKDTPGMD